jgi:hypothetical protein
VDGDLGKLRFLLGREMHFHAFKVRENRHFRQAPEKCDGPPNGLLQNHEQHFRPFQGLRGKWPIPMARAMGYSLALYEL